MDFTKDYYSILRVPRTASAEEIKAAYRQLSKEYHPDHNRDNPQAGEKMKEINEAKEVLLNEVSRYVYDEYWKKAEQIKAEQQRQGRTSNASSTQAGATKNKRTYQRTRTERTERRIYVRGVFEARFWAEPEDNHALSIHQPVHYLIHPVSAEALIEQSDIHPFDPPPNFQKVFSQAALFRSLIPQPVKCKIVTQIGIEYYELDLQDLKIVDPVLSDVIKHEKQSLGTIRGNFYAWVLRVDEREVTETVTECYGETGNSERKEEGGSEFIRKEYYHHDCSRYWGAWYEVAKPKPNSTSPRGRPPTRFSTQPVSNGCASLWWLPLAFIAIIAWPKFFLSLLIIGLVVYLFSIGTQAISRVLPFLFLLLVGYIFFLAFRSPGTKTALRTQPEPSYDTLRTQQPVWDSSGSFSKDSMIHHYIAWRDYDDRPYAVTLSISINAVRAASHAHNRMELPIYASSLSTVYDYLQRNDEQRLQPVIRAFDSIRQSAALDEVAFANMLVSCIQSVPYYLILDRSCDPDFYMDEFVNLYLKNCQGECCLGYSKFGVRSPAEFIGDLKGDCDTRALLIYSLLKAFDYPVALLVSDYYKHAVVAVHYPNAQAVSGLALSINTRNYFLWETTSKGFRPGAMPPQQRNLQYWKVALLHEKNN